MDKNFVCYKDFGAVGDGVTNDFFAFKAAHDYANAHFLPVRGEEGKTYRLETSKKDGIVYTVTVMTDTDFCGATVIFDDTDIGGPDTRDIYQRHIFSIENRYSAVEVEQKYLDKINEGGGINSKTTKRIDTGLGYPAMLVLFNKDKRHFIRFGGNEDSGKIQKELTVVDKDGNIDELTPFLFDFERVSSITAYRIDIPTLTFGNGHFITRASQVNIGKNWCYMNRGIEVKRPNTHIKDIVHDVVGEIDKGTIVNGEPFNAPCYNGFIHATNTHNVLVENVTFQSRVYYLQGTYDIGGNTANLYVFKNCKQSNFYAGDPKYPLMPSFGKWWGVAGTNYCKNMIYDGCELTRYDAHTGVVNGKIINSTVGGIRLTGGGDMLIENSKIYYWGPRSPISLREDYGATWNGTVTIKDSVFADVTGEGNCSCLLVAQSSNWNFGYKTHFPNLIIDNLKYENAKPEMPLLMEFTMGVDDWANLFYRSIYDYELSNEGEIAADGEPNINPYTPPSFIKVINNENNGYTFTLPRVPFFKDTEITGIKITEPEKRLSEPLKK